MNRWAAVFGLTALLFAFGCNGDSGSSGNSEFAGEYRGTFAGNLPAYAAGTWFLGVEPDGQLTGSYSATFGGRVDLTSDTGTVDDLGRFTLTVPNSTTMWTGRIVAREIDGNDVYTVNGTWTTMTEAGTFVGSRGDFAVGTWSGTFTSNPAPPRDWDSGTWSLTVAPDGSISGFYVIETVGQVGQLVMGPANEPFLLSSINGEVSEGGKFAVGVPESGLPPGLFPASGLPRDDCNENGIDDAVDISSGASLDNNTNGVPDECEVGVRLFDGLFLVTIDPATQQVTYTATGNWIYADEGLGIPPNPNSKPKPRGTFIGSKD